MQRHICRESTFSSAKQNFETFQKLLISELKEFRQIQPVYDKGNAITGWKSIEDPAVEPVTKARGGIIYASTGKLVNYEPRGTDTVPAMLTPGEFVVNRRSTQKHLPVLQAINSGTYSAGGIAEYLKVGGIINPKYYTTPTNKPITGNNSMFDFTSLNSA